MDERTPFGLMVVRMEPVLASDNEEFNEWYDTEHIPHRMALPGFLSSQRWVCLQGWPRYAATYDLDSPDATLGAEYKAQTGHGFSAWSRRVLSRVGLGWSRLDMAQVFPGRQMARAEWSGMTLLQFRGDQRELAVRVAERLASELRLAQVRAFAGTAAPDPATAIMIEAPAWPLLPTWSAPELLEQLADLAASLSVANTYTKYSRTDAHAAVLTRVADT